MKKGITGLFIFFLTLVCSSMAFANKNTLYVDKGIIYTAAGEPFVMRGFNEMFVWSEDKTGAQLIPQGHAR